MFLRVSLFVNADFVFGFLCIFRVRVTFYLMVFVWIFGSPMCVFCSCFGLCWSVLVICCPVLCPLSSVCVDLDPCSLLISLLLFVCGDSMSRLFGFYVSLAGGLGAVSV